MPKLFLLDTNILIDFARRRKPAVDFVLGLPHRPLISAITVAELYGGVREGNERKELDEFVSRSKVIHVDAQIAEHGGLMFRQYAKSHGVGFADAVIAATAEIERATLVTLNRKHFPMLSDILVPYTIP